MLTSPLRKIPIVHDIVVDKIIVLFGDRTEMMKIFVALAAIVGLASAKVIHAAQPVQTLRTT